MRSGYLRERQPVWELELEMFTLQELKEKNFPQDPVYRNFLAPADRCVMCESQLLAQPGQFGTYVLLDSTGEGECSVCRYPNVERAGKIYQWHPNVLWDEDIPPRTLFC